MKNKEKIYKITYIDAYYSYKINIKQTKLPAHETYGYVKKGIDNITVIFIKELETNKDKKNEKNIIKGLVIPNTALVSTINILKIKLSKKLHVSTKIKVMWRDVVYVANTPRQDCSIMQSEGILYRIEKDHIVLKNPETLRTYPLPIKKHPAKKPTFYIIPLSLIDKVTVSK